MQMARMRALETGRYLLRATNTGITAFVDDKGKIVKRAPMFERAVLTADVVPMAGLTPFARIGDRIVMIGFLLIAVFVLIGDRNVRRQ